MVRVNPFGVMLVEVLIIAFVPSCAYAARIHAYSGTAFVSIFNDAGVTQNVLQRAEERAAEIFEAAGIEIHWILCAREPDGSDRTLETADCTSFDNPSHLSVRIVPRASAIGKDVFGEAILDEGGLGVYAKVYYSSLFASVADEPLDEGAMLGYVMAHEVGHLLLGANSHSSEGLMCAHWWRGELHQASLHFLFFTSKDAASLRSRFGEAECVRKEHDGARNPSSK